MSIFEGEKPKHYPVTRPYRLVLGTIIRTAQNHEDVKEKLLADMKEWGDLDPEYNRFFDELFRRDVRAKRGTRANPRSSKDSNSPRGFTATQ